MTQQKLPTNLKEIRAIAERMFQDKTVLSINIEATWGEVTVSRNGEIKTAK